MQAHCRPNAIPDPARNGANKGSLDLDSVVQGAYGELLRRVAQSPLNFNFTWHGTSFSGSISGHDDGLRMYLQSNLADIPFSAENAAARGDLLAIVDTHRGGKPAELRVVQGQNLVLDSTLDLPAEGLETVNGIISTLTVMVLRSAPYLDLLAKRASEIREISAPHSQEA